MTTPPTANRSADRADVVHDRLREAILSAELRPNHRLVEKEIGDWLEVSRTPVREALFRLAQEGLVVQRRGWVVRDHTAAEILEIMEARAGVEAHAAFLAAQRISEPALTRLEELIETTEDDSISRLQRNELNSVFHDVITEAATNTVVEQLHRRTRINYWNLNQPVVFTPADDEIVNTQHRRLVASLRAGDGETAARVAREHVENTARIIRVTAGLR
ncbi:putative GntR-family transcriptional regulator [Actinoplanes missouriensis 431]|uniref:Putative GntR-family transcriptional regulator n=1 Tax=Actinoplanes missouriensis (strain ATCC 14538 / DSM 43046 / CBS 188.64 / JCM 3121 / NBRC 102363 / NCIMB 12654 / NRRL B-3342 / UNCC 431) TaxID=512565 RepID=I0H6M9_ACTM4|nr:GntR family transcriptional regulator [Actinoplanes missouriensis]BAL88666.1 putative GntR-family transcriptional regulator [Actinoplanes missouriensis 431]